MVKRKSDTGPQPIIDREKKVEIHVDSSPGEGKIRITVKPHRSADLTFHDMALKRNELITLLQGDNNFVMGSGVQDAQGFQLEVDLPRGQSASMTRNALHDLIQDSLNVSLARFAAAEDAAAAARIRAQRLRQ